MFQKPVHIPSPTNIVVDAISRNNMGIFQSQVPKVVTMAPARIPPISGQSPNPAVPRLDISRLFPVVQEVTAAGIASSIRKVYRTGEGRYSKFCAQVSLPDYPTT